MKRLIALALIAIASAAHGQCAPGISGAGNPGCIPPNQTNSPYYQGASVTGIPPQNAGHWEDRWGAVAIDVKLLKAGFLVDQTTKSDAEGQALSRCEAEGGNSCEIIISFHNQCASIAQQQESHQLSTATAADAKEADSRSLRRCGSNCKIIYNQCSLPELINQ